ncbi:MAG: HAMP domain-containing histidine kinase [Magnetococcales bacterium]|nr:HAMP domain-containing histidine kinase [Magnetococcales bacterium]
MTEPQIEVDSPPVRKKGRLSLTVKLIFPAMIAALISWLLLDYLQNQTTKKTSDNHLMQMIKQQSLEDRNKLDGYFKQQSDIVKIFVRLAVFRDYMEEQEAVGWTEQNPSEVLTWTGYTPWMPDRASTRKFAGGAPIFLLFDPQDRLREIFMGMPNRAFQGFIADIDPSMLVLEEEETTLLEHKKKLYLISTAKAPMNEMGMPRATLAMVIPIDDSFLLSFHRRELAKGIVAFLDVRNKKVIASSHPLKVPDGISTTKLKNTYNVDSTSYFDFDYASDLPIEFASLTPLIDMQMLAQEMVSSQRTYRFFTAGLLIVAFGGILTWVAGKLRNFSQQMISYSRQHLGIIGQREEVERDELERIGSQFIRLVDEMVLTRKREELQQDKLIETEKMAALGSLVAGVAHEINTPIGIAFTASSFLEKESIDIKVKYDNQKLSRSDLDRYIDLSRESSQLIFSNLDKAANLVRSFKQVAVDQSSEQIRTFLVKEFIAGVLDTLSPLLKRTQHTVDLECAEDLKITSYPGAFSQIITNMINNSLQHGFEEDTAGKIKISVYMKNNLFEFHFSDNGKGMDEDLLNKLYEPFHTTKRSEGGTGLGMHIVYNLVSQTIGGSINCQSSPSKGTHFIIHKEFVDNTSL